MEVKKAIRHHLEYHNVNSQKNTCRCVEFVLRKYSDNRLLSNYGFWIRTPWMK